MTSNPPSVVHRPTYVQRQVFLDQQLLREPELERERDGCTEGEPVHHQVYPYPEPVSVEEEPEAETDTDGEMVEQLDDLRLSERETDHQISTMAVNLKVSWELLQQASRSLDTVEQHIEEDPLDQLLRDAPSDIQTDSSSNYSGVSSAVGPPSKKYSVIPQGGEDWGKSLEAQLLSREWELLSQEDLSLWLSNYPLKEHQEEEGGSSDHYMTVAADLSTEEQSHYMSAVDGSLPYIISGNKQQTSSSEEDADVTVEVCKPAPRESRLQDTHNTHDENNFEKIDTDPDVSGTLAQCTPKTNILPSAPLQHMPRMIHANKAQLDMALLAELSSIKASPAPAQEKLCSISVSGRGPPCNSTPRSPDVRRRVMTGFIEANLQDSPVCDPPTPVYQQSESFTTPRDTSVDSDSSLQGFFTTCQEEEVSETASTVEGEGMVEQEEGEGEEASDQTEESQEEVGPTGVPVEEEEEEGRAEEEEMEEGLQMVKECTEGEENMEAEEGKSNDEEGSEEEEHDCCDPQRAVGSEVMEEDEEEDIDDRKEIAGNVEEGGDNVLMKIRELAADPVAAPHQIELRVSPGSQSPSVFDDTNRAHSTLDDVLQGYLEEGTTKSPVASKSVTKL
ncbi:uncharacterized protein [Notothenia coriiceps]|uniref:Uncharacterized protein n=1 Tax=Notothenia coriiceps TaxID=8208 RepID=A0A6I9PC73_9TELE|nr:PREDICTED: uncharacterized protein LOC104958376 [Notothenia coriiceps]